VILDVQRRQRALVMAQAKPRLTIDPGPRYERCVDEALAALRKAADQWVLGHPERPLAA